LEAKIIEIIPTRAGVWQGVYRPWEVLKRDSIWLLGKPITVDHPQDGVTAGSYIVGQIKDVQADDGKQEIICEAEIWPEKLPEELQQKINSGEPLDLSVGFFAITDDEQGQIDDKVYTSVEKNIYFDHVAIVTRGVCSSEDGCGINIMSRRCSKRQSPAPAPLKGAKPGKEEQEVIIMSTEQQINSEEVSPPEQVKKIYIVPRLVRAEDGSIKVHTEESEIAPEAADFETVMMQMIEEIRNDLMEQIKALTEQNAQLTAALEALRGEKQKVEEEARAETLSEISKYVTNADLAVYKTMDLSTLKTVVAHIRSIAEKHQDMKATPIVLTTEPAAKTYDDIEKEFKKQLGLKV